MERELFSPHGTWTTRQATIAALFAPIHEVHAIGDDQVDIIFGGPNCPRDAGEADVTYVRDRLDARGEPYAAVRLEPEMFVGNGVFRRVEVLL